MSKIPSALRRGQNLRVPTVSTPRPGPVRNYYAKVGDDYVHGACQKRPARHVVEAHHKELQEKAQQEREAAAALAEQKAEAQRQAQAEREAQQATVSNPQEPVRMNRPLGTHSRVMIGSTIVGMMAAGEAIRRY